MPAATALSYTPLLCQPVRSHLSRKARSPVNAPSFTPVATRKQIAGWTVQKQLEFIRHLAAFGSVRDAARSVGMSEASAYRLRSRPTAESFCEAWNLALRQAAGHLMSVAVERALNGSRKEYWKNGRLIGTEVVHSDKLLMWAVDRLSAPRPGPSGIEAAILLTCKGRDQRQLEGEDEAPFHLAGPAEATGLPQASG